MAQVDGGHVLVQGVVDRGEAAVEVFVLPVEGVARGVGELDVDAEDVDLAAAALGRGERVRAGIEPDKGRAALVADERVLVAALDGRRDAAEHGVLVGEVFVRVADAIVVGVVECFAEVIDAVHGRAVPSGALVDHDRDDFDVALTHAWSHDVAFPMSSPRNVHAGHARRKVVGRAGLGHPEPRQTMHLRAALRHKNGQNNPMASELWLP